MQLTGLPLHSLAIEPAIDRHPLTVTPDTPLVNVLALMSRVRSSCVLPTLNSATHAPQSTDDLRNPSFLFQEEEMAQDVADRSAGCVLVMQESQLVGVFTDRDIVKLAAAGTSLEGVKIADVLPRQVITLSQSQAQDVFTVLSLFRQHRIRHLPIVDDRNQLVGIVTHESIRKALQPVNLLTRLRYVHDVMTPQVVHAPPTATVLDLAQLMAQQRVSCVVIAEELSLDGEKAYYEEESGEVGWKKIIPNSSPDSLTPSESESKIENPKSKIVVPLGIVTERDIVQFQALELNLSRMQAKDVMSTPLFSLIPSDTLWVAHEEMQRRRVRRLVVVGRCGELVGIVSQTSLLQVLNPADMYGVIEVLQQAVDERTRELKTSNHLLRQEVIERKRAEKALQQAHDDLKRQVEEQTAELEKANALLKQDILERVTTEAALRQSETQLREQATQLEATLHELQKTQAQLIQTEKMSSLGQLVAGIAHEINNPINFIYGNITYASQYIQDMQHLLQLYIQHYPQPVPEIQEAADAIDLDFVNRDLPKLLGSMKVGADRIRDLVLSLRNFARLDECEMKYVDIHEGIESTLLILQNQLKAKPGRPEIQVIKNYGKLPLVECHAGQLNQVFMNILSNAIDAVQESFVIGHLSLAREKAQIAKDKGQIQICTKVVSDNRVEIRISDNGSGMSDEVRQRLFDPFFTTKPVGAGTGLGLSISYQIVKEKHGGQLRCISAPGQGAEFVIEIPMQQQNHSSGLAIA